MATAWKNTGEGDGFFEMSLKANYDPGSMSEPRATALQFLSVLMDHMVDSPGSRCPEKGTVNDADCAVVDICNQFEHEVSRRMMEAKAKDFITNLMGMSGDSDAEGMEVMEVSGEDLEAFLSNLLNDDNEEGGE